MLIPRFETFDTDILKGEQSMHHFSALLSLVKTQLCNWLNNQNTRLFIIL